MSQILLLYGTTTGNTQVVATKIQQLLSQANHQVNLKNVSETDVNELQNYTQLVVGCSTWDDGQLQADMKDFLDKLNASQVSLSGKKIALFALGDSGYPQFCASAELLQQAFIKEGVTQSGETLRIDGFPDMPENQSKTDEWVKALLPLL